MKLIIISALVAVALSLDAPANRRQAAYQGNQQFYEPKPYSYEYSVKDDLSSNDYGHKQSSDGQVVTGTYYVLLPDGRRQVVNYRADANGYVADVKYEGEARFPAPIQNRPVGPVNLNTPVSPVNPTIPVNPVSPVTPVVSVPVNLTPVSPVPVNPAPVFNAPVYSPELVYARPVLNLPAEQFYGRPIYPRPSANYVRASYVQPNYSKTTPAPQQQAPAQEEVAANVALETPATVSLVEADPAPVSMMMSSFLPSATETEVQVTEEPETTTTA